MLPRSGGRIVSGNVALKVDHLDVYYGDFQALWDVSLEVKEGEVVDLGSTSGRKPRSKKG